jgi:predicted enzyme related to lactoylglutathione lyase
MDAPPEITAPVMRMIGARDVGRTAAFYRDILGFEVREQEGALEAWYGPARVRFGMHDYSPLEWDEQRPAGSAILFFEVNDVIAMHTAICARGGTPTGIEKVNGIKMRVFEIRDPDGHALWFGQSYHQPDIARPQPLLKKALPELPFGDVGAAVVHYRDVLGFRVDYQQHDLGVMYRDEVTVLLIARTDQHKGIGSFEVYVADADKLYNELREKGAQVQGEPVSRPWGLRDFTVLDVEGNRITFAQPFE